MVEKNNKFDIMMNDQRLREFYSEGIYSLNHDIMLLNSLGADVDIINAFKKGLMCLEADILNWEMKRSQEADMKHNANINVAMLKRDLNIPKETVKGNE